MKYTMEDGRSFTDYRPSCTIDYSVQKLNKLNLGNNTHEYRYFLQRNANKIIEQNKNYFPSRLIVNNESLTWKPKRK